MFVLGLASLKKVLLLEILEHSAEQKACSLRTIVRDFTSPGVCFLLLGLCPPPYSRVLRLLIAGAASPPCTRAVHPRDTGPGLAGPQGRTRWVTALLWCPLPLAVLCPEFLVGVKPRGLRSWCTALGSESPLCQEVLGAHQWPTSSCCFCRAGGPLLPLLKSEHVSPVSRVY